MSIGDISGVLALLLVCGSIIKSLLESRNLTKTAVNIDANSISKLQETLNTALSANKILSDQFATFRTTSEKQNQEHAKEIVRLTEMHEKEMKKLSVMYDDMQDWAERLCSQVRSLGGEPVQIRKHLKPT
jgi:hypothetical protein